MDAGIIRGLGTLTLLVSFVILCLWAWAPSQRRRFEEAAHLPFLGDDAVRPESNTGRHAR